MKKLMIVAAAALCAAYANAASFTWKCTANMTDDTGATLTSMSPAGTLALVYLGNDSANVDWTAAKVVDTFTPTFSSSMGNSVAKGSKLFSFDMADYGNGDIFGVVFKDGSDKLFYLQQGGANYTPTYTISGLADDTSTLTDFNFASSSFFGSTAPSAAVAAVPEPTSAMLLLLGMAGLALRRKRA